MWGNGGHALGRTTVDGIGERTAPLEEKLGLRHHTYWDVAVVHQDDVTAIAAIDRLVPASQAL